MAPVFFLIIGLLLLYLLVTGKGTAMWNALVS